MKKSFRNVLNSKISKLLPYFSCFMKRNKNLWVFGAWQGHLYGDNSKAMFEYVSKERPNIDCYWITKDNNVYNDLISAGIKCYKAYSVRGIWAVMHAAVAFETEGNGDISYFLNPKKTIVIQLWHGVAPKKANWSSFETSHWHDQYWMVSSEQNRLTMRELIGMEDNHAYVTGYPRNDVFFIDKPKSKFGLEIEDKYPSHKKVIYMPTHRNFGTEGPKVRIDDLKIADKFFKENRIVFVFKPHFHELKYYINQEIKFENIIIADDNPKYSDVYSYIGEFDLLVSDYSSIIYDFTCSGKPIVLFPYDLNTFKNNDAGLFDYYFTYPCGPFCYDWNSVLSNIVQLLKHDDWVEKRESCRKIFHPFKDGLNRKRVLACTEQIMNN